MCLPNLGYEKSKFLPDVYQVSSPNRDYIVGFAKELLARAGIAEFDWNSDYQVGDVRLV
ncbi:MAG: hypothetical protein LBG60_00225 [Bifidobacteriaceae bacterium]|nr:hypothetical protein [Bifidobacteriaceae bacterium]